MRDVPADADIVARIKELIEEHPPYGYRRIWARLRVGDGRVINPGAPWAKVRRLLRQQGWMVRQRPAAPKPRVQRKQRVATRRNARWALDVLFIYLGSLTISHPRNSMAESVYSSQR
jgi:putative transposase